jgi:hypothetical protein
VLVVALRIEFQVMKVMRQRQSSLWRGSRSAAVAAICAGLVV